MYYECPILGTKSRTASRRAVRDAVGFGTEVKAGGFIALYGTSSGMYTGVKIRLISSSPRSIRSRKLTPMDGHQSVRATFKSKISSSNHRTRLKVWSMEPASSNMT